MFSKKTPKSQKPDNVPLYFHRFHSTSPDYSVFWKDNYRQLVIFDIGYENLCIRIERRYISPRKMKMIALEKTPVKIDTDEDNFRVLFRNVDLFISKWKKDYLETHVFLIEWQLPQNYKAVRISTFILSYFYMTLKDTPLLPLLVEMRSGFKDDYFPVLKPLNQNARKNKSEELGREQLDIMGDTESLYIMDNRNSKSKKKRQDDEGDVVLMSEAFCRYLSDLGYSFPHYRNVRRITLKRTCNLEK